MLGTDEVSWIDAYHAGVFARLAERVRPETRDWLARATAPL
jgi:Xaa-Pro aminopeptidase